MHRHGLAGAALGPLLLILLSHAGRHLVDRCVGAGGQRACAGADGGGELCSAQPGEHGARAAPAAGDHAGVPASHLPWRLHDWRSQAAQHAHPGRVLSSPWPPHILRYCIDRFEADPCTATLLHASTTFLRFCHCHCISHMLSGPRNPFECLLEDCLAVHRMLTLMTS